MKSKLTQWYELFPVVLSAGITRVLLHGPPDTGKTTTAAKLGMVAGRGVYRLQCSRDQGIEDLLGQFVLENGSTRFVPGPIPQAMASGGMLIADEIDMRNPAHDSIYHATLDDLEIAEVRLPDGTSVKPKAGFTVICTTNASPGSFTSALLRRFELKLLCRQPHPQALESIGADQAKFLQNCIAATKAPEFRFEFGVSSFRSVQKLIAGGIDEAHALRLVFGEGAAVELESALASIAN